MKTLIISAMLVIFGTVIGLEGSQLCFAFIIAGIVVAMYGIRKIQVERGE